MRNKDIRIALRHSDVKQWQLAEALGVSEVTICRWLRQKLPDEKRMLILQAIKDVEAKNEEE